MQRPTIGLVVPALEDDGGVPSVAEFIYQVIQRSGAFNTRLVSLSMSALDGTGLAISRPSSWMRGVQSQRGRWRGRPYTRVGAFASELEFQRFMRRPALTKAVAGCDLIQVVCGSPALANAVTGLGIPVSLQVATRAKVERRYRDSQPKTVVNWWRRTMTQVTDILDDRALRTVDAIQVENQWMLDYSRHVNRGRNGVDIQYAPPGVNDRLFTPLQERPFATNPYILCVGRLDDPRKNIVLLLEAFNRLPGSLTHVQLVTAGSARPPAIYWERVEAMGLQHRVRHVHRPETEDLVRLYQEAAVLALSSDEEGFGVVLLESMACGVPVVATRCGGPDGIITDGKEGFLVPLHNAYVMADRLDKLCSDQNMNRAMGRNARQTIDERYAQEVAGEAFVRVWHRLLNRTRKR